MNPVEEDDSLLDQSSYRREFISGGFYEDERSELQNDKLRSAVLCGSMIASVFAGTIALGKTEYEVEVDFEDYNGSEDLDVEIYSNGELTKDMNVSSEGFRTELESGNYKIQISDSDNTISQEFDISSLNQELSFSLEDL
ncbi:MAG: hypothetical protein H8Z69_00855 [Nanohaloarchaea archaeon]|nr:hypothetical protein [Candidatus Nanohaloarchaea archaeon]